MQIVSHLALSWFTAEVCGLDDERDRRAVALAGIAPDVDAVAYPIAYVLFGFDLDRAYSEVWQPVHHHYTHGMGFAILTLCIVYCLTRRRRTTHRFALKVAGLAALVSLAHVFCDVVGAGPGWPVYPLWPWSDAAWSVPWSWNVSDWPNSAITIAMLAATLLYARAAGRSPIECLSPRLDRRVVDILHGRGRVPSRRARIRLYAGLAALCAIIVIPLVLGTT